MAQQIKKKIPIKYTSRDFDSIKRDLVEIAKRDYPNVSRDFNEASVSSMFFDTVAYIGDILSFYLDYSVNESFLDTAVEYNNVLKLGREKGYRFKGNPTSSGIATFFVIVPANTYGLGPNLNYAPILKKGSQFSSTSGNGFILNENIYFENSDNEVVVAQVDSVTGLPSSYAIKAYGEIISGELIEETIEIGEFEKFKKVLLSGEDISEIISVTDSEGHEYYEVEFLSQDVIYVPILNEGVDKEYAPNILKPISVARRFVTERDRKYVTLCFGYGSAETIQENPIIDPSSTILQIHGKNYDNDTSFDPSKLLQTDKFGVAPSNTYLSIVYRKNSSENVNAGTDSITEVKNAIWDFRNTFTLSSATKLTIQESLEVTNENPIIGDVTLPNTEELKRRVYDTFATQNRAVTQEDYKSVVYNMPPKYGAVKRVSVQQDTDSFKRNLNMYIVSENRDGTLCASTDTIKKNVKNWLISKKMINDTVDILDAKIVNIGIEFEVIAQLEENKYSALNSAVQKLADYYETPLDIGESLSISTIYTLLNEVPGIADVVNVKIVRKYGGNYSDIKFSIDEYMSADGRYLANEPNFIFEIKYPLQDISGIIK